MRSKTQQQVHALLYALCVGAGISLLFIPTQIFAQDDPVDEPQDEPVELERFAVTGSRIKRVDAEGALPVTIIDREMIELSGESSVADFLRSLSFNSFGSYRSQMGGTDHGTSQISLRGLGSNRSLVLIDGRRLPKAPQSTAYQNLNSIPMGSVERVEILSDGASAIYGSDAIGGVINIITRDDYNGWELMYGQADSNAGGGERDYGSVMFGTSGTDWNLIATASWNSRDISYNSDYDWYEPGASYYGNNFGTRDAATGLPNWDITDIPGGCDNSDAYFLVPDPWSLTGEYCAYDYNLIAGNETSVDTSGGLVKAEYDINNDWTVWLNTSISKTDAYGRYAPQPITSTWNNYPIPVDGVNNPTNPDSPMYDPRFGPNVEVDFWHRVDSLGPRELIFDTTLIDLQLGITGWLGKAELDFGLRRTWNSTEAFHSNYLNYWVALEYIVDGTYDLQNSLDNPEEVLDAMRENYKSPYDYDQNEVFASVAWDLFEINAVPVKWLVGGEFRQEMFNSDVWWDDQQHREADRDITSLFFETLVPATDNLELSIAGRYDNYSDWGSDFSPKLSLRWRATDKIMLRASVGEGFRVPELIINTVEPASGFNYTDTDPLSCEAIGRPPGCPILFQSISTVSPALTSETSDQYAFGVAWEPSDWFNLTLDYYDITLEEEIRQFGDYEILQFEQLGQAIPPGLGVTRDQSGLLLSITSGWGNLGLVETSGLDLNAQLIFDLGPGHWSSTFQASYVFELVIDEDVDWVGMLGNPQSRATFSNNYAVGDFAFAWNIQYISGQARREGYPDAPRIPSWVTHDLQVNYHAPWNGQFTIGAQNAFDKKPTIGIWNNYDSWLYNGFGRIIYAQYTQAF